jgi:hypothetical protein
LTIDRQLTAKFVDFWQIPILDCRQAASFCG